MRLRTLRLRSFRAHADTRVEFGSRVNLLHGPNGAGKTNLLEAIHYLCLGKSFLTTQDAHALRRGDDFFEITGAFEGERRPHLAVRLAYVPGEGKRLFVNDAPLDRLAEVVGMLPVVAMAPEDHVLTAGGPDERRRFLDNVLSQAWPAYLQDLLRYRRALRQRNALLQSLRRQRGPVGPELDAWTDELASTGARITWRRHRFLGEFAAYLQTAYQRIEALGEIPTFRYAASIELDDSPDEASIAARAAAVYERVAQRERERGRTLAGPHRDDLIFMLDGIEVRPYASQGQHRTFGLALKLATYAFLEDRLGESPILLLDDLFGMLDPRRSSLFLDLLQSDAIGQSVLTAARTDPFDRVVDFGLPEHSAVPVVNGQVGVPIDA